MSVGCVVKRSKV